MSKPKLLTTVVLVIALAVTSFLVPGQARAQESQPVAQVVEMRLVENPTQIPTAPQSPDAAQCAIGVPFGPPGWLVGLTCVVFSVAGITMVLGATAMVMTSSGTVQNYEGQVTVVDATQPIVVWNIPGYGEVTTQMEATAAAGQFTDTYVLVTQPAMARLKDPTREDEDPRADYEPHWGGTRHPEADQVYWDIYQATGGGYHEPGGPNDKWKCLMSLAYRLPIQNGIQNAWSHTRYIMAYDDGFNTNWLVWGEVYKANKVNGVWNFINVGEKNFLITGYHLTGGWNRALSKMGQMLREGWKPCGPDDFPPLPPLGFAVAPGVCITAAAAAGLPQGDYCPNPNWEPGCREVLVNNDPHGWRSYWKPASEALASASPPADWSFQTNNKVWKGPLPWVCPFKLWLPTSRK